MKKRIKKILDFLKFIEEERMKASIHCGTASNLY